MTKLVSRSTDARQSHEWSNFLRAIGWQAEKIDTCYVFYRKLPLLGTALKIQHPKGPLPLAKIDEFAKKQHAIFSIIEPHIIGYDEHALTKAGYRTSSMRFAHTATYLLDLRLSEKELWNMFSENARRNIKKAQKQCDVIVKTTGGSDSNVIVKEFYELYHKLGRTKHFYVPSFHEVASKIKAFQKTSVFLFAYEKNAPDPIAVLWIGSTEKTLFYFHPGNTLRGYELLANYLLVWEALKWGKKHKLEVFDFETAYDPRYPKENKEWKGYTEFKKKFRGELVAFPPNYIKFYNPFAKAVYRLSSLFAR